MGAPAPNPALPLNPVAAGLDVHVDIDARESLPLFFRGPPEAEGDTAGALDTYDVEVGSLAAPSISPIAGWPDAVHMPMGRYPYGAGAVAIDPGEGVARVVDAINVALAQEIAAPKGARSGQELPLGDLSSVGAGGAVTLDPTLPVTEAVEEINEVLGGVVERLQGPLGAADGFQLPLGSVETEGAGAWTPGAVPLQDGSKVSSVIDKLNAVLGKLVPTAPPDFPAGQTLNVANGAGAAPLLAQGAPDNAATGVMAGAPVTRITASGLLSNTFSGVGPGDHGVVQALLNGVVAAQRVLSGSGDVGSYAGLTISAQADYPAGQPGFWRALSLRLDALACPVGLNRAALVHSAAGASNAVTFVRDPFTTAPALSSVAVSQQSAGVLNYSSGVPHYGAGATLTLQATLEHLSGLTYYGGGDPLSASLSAGAASLQAFNYGSLGVTTPLPVGLDHAVLAPVVLAVNGQNVHAAARVEVTARNVNGSAALEAGPVVLVKAGAATTGVDELSVPVAGLGASPSTNNAARVALSSGPTPSGAAQSWSPTASLPIYEASVVGGVVSNDVTDYSHGFLPAGPDYSVGRAGPQYVTFAFNRAAVSAFKINVAGTYDACHVKLPGVTDSAAISPNAPSGWLDAFAPYTGAGVPGSAQDPNAGAALGSTMNGHSGSFQITFGTQSSTNAQANQILVRFKLSAGQSITALSFTN